MFAGVRKDADAERLAADPSGRVRAVRLDVTVASDIAAAVETVRAELGSDAGLDGLVNNAGIAVAGPMEFVPIDELRRQLEVNVVGVVAVTQAFLPMLRRARGRIVNVGSISGLSTVPFLGPYSASKHALEAVSDALRIELAPLGVQVTILEPGSVSTPIWDRSLAAADAALESRAERIESVYGLDIDFVRRAAGRMTDLGIPADDIARAVSHALTARRPPAHRIVGRMARMRRLLELLPTRWRDALIRRGLRSLGG